MAGGEFELSIEALQAIEFKRFRVIMILCDGVFSEAPVTDRRAVYPGVSQRDGSKVRLLSGLPEKSVI